MDIKDRISKILALAESPHEKTGCPVGCVLQGVYLLGERHCELRRRARRNAAKADIGIGTLFLAVRSAEPVLH